MVDDPQEYIRQLFDPGNPIYYSLFFTIALLVTTYLLYKNIIIPLRRNHLIEKKELELKNIKLMALFAELDPNPLIRINPDGIIIHTNDAAAGLTNNRDINGIKISELLPSIDFSISEFIRQDKSKVFYQIINNKYYSITFRGISYLKIAQIYFNDLTERKMIEQKLEISQSKLRVLSTHLHDTLEDERQRIARELHDSIGQNLHLIRLKLQNNNIELSYNDFETVKRTVETSINELKEIIFNLKPKILEEMGLGISLKLLVQKISLETGIQGFVDVHGFEERLDKKLELSLYRVSQEALSNIIKHSRASEFNIQLFNKGESIKLLISDNGIGLDSTNNSENKFKSGFGLFSMQERINSYNGRLKIESQNGNGTLIIAEIPRRNITNGR